MWQKLHCREYQEILLSPRRPGILQGDLGPLSNRSVVETCVLPVLMYECESWIQSEGHLKLLEAFQGEMAKRILKLPKRFSNTAAVTALDWPQ